VLTVTISDLRKRHHDEAGKRLDAELALAGLSVVRHVTVADEPKFIADLVQRMATNNEADAIVLTGGTGINPRDQTFEALDKLYEKRIDGFGEAFRRLAFESMGPRAMFYRASAGVFEQCVIFSLPGNVESVVLGVRQLIAPTLVASVEMAAGRETHTTGSASARGDRPSTRDLSSATGSVRDVNASAKTGGDAPPTAT